MSDDAEFEAFLKGDGELSRALQGMPQPAPSAALDAAILGRIRTSMEQQQQAAANDPGEAVPTPRLARGLGMRWRVPAGIAASALVGLFAVQAYRSDVSGDLVSAPAMERAADTIIAQETAPPAAPAPAADAPPAFQVQPAMPAAPAAEPSPAPEKAAMSPSPRQPAPVTGAGKDERASAKRAKPVAIVPADAYQPRPDIPVVASANIAAAPAPAPVVTQAPAPAAPVPSQEAAAKAAIAAQAGLYDAERRRAEPKSLAQNFREAPVAAPPPAPTAREAATAAPAAPATVANATNVRPSGGSYSRDFEKVEITGSRIKAVQNKSPSALWIERIEALLKDGREDAALREWEKFREKYPREDVSPELAEKMKALSEQGR